MKIFISALAAVFLLPVTVYAEPGENACTRGNASFCEPQRGTDSQRPLRGPQGEAGSQGEAGTNGTNGTDGTNGTNGTNGTDGIDGTNGIDGVNFNASDHEKSLAAATAIGSLQMANPGVGETTWGFGVGGQIDGVSAVAAGISYGFTSDLSGYVSMGTTSGDTSYGLGLSGRF